MKSDVAERLKLLRKSLNLSQKELADKIEIAQTYWSSIETGHRKLPPTILGLLVKEFGLSADWILSGTGQPFTSGESGPVVTGKMDELIETRASEIFQAYDKLVKIIELEIKAFGEDPEQEKYINRMQKIWRSSLPPKDSKLKFDQKANLLHYQEEILKGMAKDFTELFDKYYFDIGVPKRRVEFKAPGNLIKLKV